MTVFEQNYEANLVNTRAILEKYIDKNITIRARYGNNSVKKTGVLLGYNDGYIIQSNKGINVINNVDSVKFNELPEGFFNKPTLNWKVFS